MLAGTPLYRSAAVTPADFLHGWAISGAYCNHLGFDESNHSGTQAHTTHIAPSLQHRKPGLHHWAGAFFEQAQLGLLPGPLFFMQEHLIATDQNAPQVLPYPTKADSCHRDRRRLFPPGVHFFGGAKHLQPLVLKQMDQWFSLVELLAGTGTYTPFFAPTEQLVHLGQALAFRGSRSELPPPPFAPAAIRLWRRFSNQPQVNHYLRQHARYSLWNQTRLPLHHAAVACFF